jgi:predicted transcriptional regulator
MSTTETLTTSSALRARDVMEKDVITIAPETPLLDVHRLFVEEEIHGAPVVDDDGQVEGVISSLDLLRVVRDAMDRGDLEAAEDLTAADCMTTELVTVRPDATIDEVARTMRTQRIHRVLVAQDRVLEGVITSFDLLRVLAGELP